MAFHKLQSVLKSSEEYIRTTIRTYAILKITDIRKPTLSRGFPLTGKVDRLG